MGASSILRRLPFPKPHASAPSQEQPSVSSSSLAKALATLSSASTPSPPVLSKRSTSTYLALSIPEILEVIFDHLHQHQLINVVSFVCKTWRATARRRLDMVAYWNQRCLLEESTDKFFRHQLESADTLRCDFIRGVDMPQGFESHSSTWLHVQSAVEGVSNSHGKNRIKRIVLEGLKVKVVDLSLFSPLSQVTDLQLVDIISLSTQITTAVWLDHVLANLPTLERIAIRFATRRFDRVNQFCYPPWKEDNPSRTNPGPSKLRSLSLETMTVDMAVLETFLCKVCPRLEDLRLICTSATTRTVAWDGTQFFQALEASCPNLITLHLSEPYSSNQDNVRKVFHSFPNLKHWGTHGNLFGSWNPHLQNSTQTFLDSLYSITSLEIYETDGRCSRLHSLHPFLCKAVHLQSLIASSVFFHEEFLEVIGSRAEKNLWACRSLKTLHLSFQLQNSPGRDKDRGNDRSRVLFAYLAIACPKLKDLQIRYSDLRMELEGGLCLLSGLEDLERLVVLTKGKYSLKEQDLEWVRNPESRTRWQRSKWDWKMNQIKRELVKTEKLFASTITATTTTNTSTVAKVGEKEQRDDGKEDRMDPNSPEELIKKMEGTNSIDGVLEVLEELAASKKRVWPKLEKMWIRSSNVAQQWSKEIDLICRLRPELVGQRPPVLWNCK